MASFCVTLDIHADTNNDVLIKGKHDEMTAAQKVGTVDEKIDADTSDLSARINKLKEKMGLSDAPKEPELKVPATEILTANEIKNKLVILRELVSNGVVSEEDYNYKKAKMLEDGMDNMSIKDQLHGIKELRTEGS